MSESAVEGEVLSFWPNRVPNQIRFADGHVDNYCDQCGKPLNSWKGSPSGESGQFQRYPEHDLGCDVRCFTVGTEPEDEAEFAEYVRSKKPA